ncbi:hypothetical protein RTP6_003382 [Batrachochytrium dendrobatidis]
MSTVTWKQLKPVLLDSLVWTTNTNTNESIVFNKPLPTESIEAFVFSQPWDLPSTSSTVESDKVIDDLKTHFKSLQLVQQTAITSNPSINMIHTCSLHRFISCLNMLLPALDPLRVFADYFEPLLWPVLTHRIASTSDQNQTCQKLLIALLRTDFQAGLDVNGVYADRFKSAARTVLDKCVAESDFWHLESNPTEVNASQSREIALADSLSSNIEENTTVNLSLTSQIDPKQTLTDLDQAVKPFRSQVLPALYHVLFSFGMSKPLVFYSLLNEMAIDPVTRLRSFMLLKAFLIWEDAPTYYLIDSVLFESVVHSATIDSDVATFTAALTILTILLPIVSSKAVARFERLMNSFLRALHWELTYPQIMKISSQVPELQDAHDKHLLQFSICATRRCIDNYFTVLYGMFPANVIAQLQRILSSGISELAPILQQSEQFSVKFMPVKDVFVKVREMAYEAIEVEEEDLFQRRVRDLVREHRIHPSIVTATIATELSNPWFTTKEASEIMVECMSLRIDTLGCFNAHTVPTTVKFQTEALESSFKACLNQVALIDEALHGHISQFQGMILNESSSVLREHDCDLVASPMLLLRIYYYVLMNESFFKECMRQYHMMHIRRLHKNAFEAGLRDASIQNLHLRFKQQSSELAEQRQLVDRLRQESIHLRERHKGHDEEDTKRLKEMRNEIQSLRSSVQNLTGKLESTAKDNVELKSRLADSERLLSQSESKLVLAERDSTRLKECEIVLSDLQTKLIAKNNTSTQVVESERHSGLDKVQLTRDMSINDQVTTLTMRIETLQMILDATERERDRFIFEQQELAFLKGQLEFKNQELVRFEGQVKEQSGHMQLLKQQFQKKIEAQDAKYASLRKLHLLLQSRIVDMTSKMQAVNTSTS